MKAGGKILIGIGAAAVVAVLAVLFVTRLASSRVVTVPLSAGRITTALSTKLRTVRYPLSGFRGVSASGAWELSIREGAHYSVLVTVPEGLSRRISVGRRGRTLYLGVKPGTTFARERLRAEVTMPSLESVELSGANRASFSGFSGARLALQCSGAATVSGAGGDYRSLTVDASGASSVLLREVSADNADIRLSGAGEAEIRMAGGVLSGSASGASTVSYWGHVSKETIRTSGIANVVHR